MDDRFDDVLSIDDPDFVEKLTRALGVAPGEALEIVTPQFDRTDGVEPGLPVGAWGVLHRFSADALKSIGCGQWDEPDDDGRCLMLFPHQWYDHIPEGMVLESIMGKSLAFAPGKTDDDRRFGMLAYGLRVRA